MERYRKEHLKNLRHQFCGAEKIEQNYSQAFQDIFVLSMLNGKRNGTYVEIGGYDATKDSNTYLLETQFDWTGVAVEIQQDRVDAYNVIRKNKCLCADAVNLNYEALFAERGFPKQIDYLQVDIEPPQQTLNALLRLPHDSYRFSVITFETDVYCGDSSPQEKAAKFLVALGYELVIRDVVYGMWPFEDWYIDPRVIDPKLVRLFRQRDCAECVLKSAP